MGTDVTRRRVARRLGCGAVAAGVLVAVAGVAMPQASANHVSGPVAICHATNSDTMPYLLETPDASGVDGDGGAGDHYVHGSGPVWNPTLKALHIKWGDIIPPIPGHHTGMNWTDEGQAILANGCVPTAAAPSAAAVQCVGGVPGITVTLSNTGTADAVFVVQQDGADVGTADELTVTGLEDTESIALPQAAGVPTVVTVSSGAFSDTFSFNSNCAVPPPPAPVPGGSAIQCAARALGIVVTLTNAGDADAVFVVLQDGARVGTVDELTVTDAEDTETITLPQVEDVDTDIAITSGAFSTAYTFDSNCTPAAPVPGGSAVQCVAGALGIVVTLTNAGDADAVFTVVQDLAAVGTLDELTVTDAENSETITLTQVEDVDTDITITSGAFSAPFNFDSDCAAAPVPGPGPGLVVAPVVGGPVTPAAPVDECPDQAGFQTDADQCVLVLSDPVTPETPVVITEAPRATPPQTAVGGEALGKALPRTGTTTLPLLETGLGMVLLGAGALLFGRERTALI